MSSLISYKIKQRYNKEGKSGKNKQYKAIKIHRKISKVNEDLTHNNINQTR